MQLTLLPLAQLLSQPNHLVEFASISRQGDAFPLPQLVEFFFGLFARFLGSGGDVDFGSGGDEPGSDLFGAAEVGYRLDVSRAEIIAFEEGLTIFPIPL